MGGLPNAAKELIRFQTRRRMFAEHYPELVEYVVRTRNNDAQVAINLRSLTDQSCSTSVFLTVDHIWCAIGTICQGHVAYLSFDPLRDGPLMYGLVVQNRTLVAADDDRVILLSDHGFSPLGFGLDLIRLERTIARINNYDNEHIDYIHDCLMQADTLKRVQSL